jgi:hypothetical protein
MASDRKAAKSAIQAQSSGDAELEETLTGAHNYQLKLTQENNRHMEAMRKADIGFLGRAFGGEKSAPTYIAFIATIGGMIGAAVCWGLAGNAEIPVNATFWSSQAERALAFASGALAFIFGRGSKN